MLDVDLRGPSCWIRTPVRVIHGVIRGVNEHIVRTILIEGFRRPDLNPADFGLGDVSEPWRFSVC